MMRPLLRILCLILLAATPAHAAYAITGPAMEADSEGGEQNQKGSRLCLNILSATRSEPSLVCSADVQVAHDRKWGNQGR